MEPRFRQWRLPEATDDTSAGVATQPSGRGASRAPEALETATNGTARPADMPPSAAVEQQSTHPLEAHLSTLRRAPLMPFDATGRMAA
jgi:hypothetical protein